MISSGYKKLAREYELKVDSGVAYGSLKGYAVTLSDGNGCKSMVVVTKIGDPDKLQRLQTQTGSTEIQKKFRLQEFSVLPNKIIINFSDTIGTLKRIRSFIEWFIPVLNEAEATKVNVCAECGTVAENGRWKLIDGVAYYFHTGCAEKVVQTIVSEDESIREADKGSYILGAVGALLGALLGAVVWFAVLTAGYIASIVGFLIGWLAEKGYNLFHGKQGRGKIAILIVMVVLGVVVGTIASDAATLAKMISAGEVYASYSDIPALLIELLQFSDYTTSLLMNVGMGLLFAALGVFTLIRKAHRDVSNTKIKDLE